MKYLMLVCTDPDYTPGQEEGAPDVMEWVTEMDGKGTRLMGSRTRPASDATTVRVRNRQVLVTDGPYAETDQAIDVASRHPMAWHGMIELRPFWPNED
jgi:hypothetical protein